MTSVFISEGVTSPTGAYKWNVSCICLIKYTKGQASLQFIRVTVVTERFFFSLANIFICQSGSSGSHNLSRVYPTFCHLPARIGSRHPCGPKLDTWLKKCMDWWKALSTKQHAWMTDRKLIKSETAWRWRGGGAKWFEDAATLCSLWDLPMRFNNWMPKRVSFELRWAVIRWSTSISGWAWLNGLPVILSLVDL